MGEDWRRYPFVLVPDDEQFRFPGAEANHPHCESDTWFLAGELAGDSGRKFAFLTIFNKNRPGQSIVADFYTFALFDLDGGTYATYTDYDMPPANLQPGATPKLTAADSHLDMTYESGAGTAVWRTRRDSLDELVPYTYDVVLVGTDHAGRQMALDLHVTPSRPPVPLGAATYNGKIECFGQAETYSYFQTGMSMAGTLRWGALEESVSGSAGHVDRQWFPLVANSGGSTGDMRSRAHEWRTINLDNGIDLSIWRQFDRSDRNALQPFSGATMDSGEDAEYAGDIEVEVLSYVRWPETVRTLVPPPSTARYMPDRHRVTSRKLDMDLTGEPLVAAPAHALPIEYMEGPYRYRGTLRGKPVSGFGFYERSLALYRDWELVDVLAAAGPGERDEVARLIDERRRD
ncbi:lipocalin-like domain-containing protein [Mycobacterium sp.]|uniref:lipocalin-like domain-containing protein n=1 Tax=Mycobacterium sp. TaxID=1785 RepID=UPI002DB22CF0|nr:lipocalin-like domain-containing protein [Mycobacterium sp.]